MFRKKASLFFTFFYIFFFSPKCLLYSISRAHNAVKKGPGMRADECAPWMERKMLVNFGHALKNLFRVFYNFLHHIPVPKLVPVNETQGAQNRHDNDLNSGHTDNNPADPIL